MALLGPGRLSGEPLPSCCFDGCVFLWQDGSNVIHVLLGSKDRVFFAITSASYPMRYVCPPAVGDATHPVLLNGAVASLDVGDC